MRYALAPFDKLLLVLFVIIVLTVTYARFHWFTPRCPAPSSTCSAGNKVALAQADKTVKAADVKIAAAAVQVKHAKAVVKVKASAAAAKLSAYEVAKSPGSGGNPAAVGDRPDGASPGRIDLPVPALQRSVAPTPELPAAETPTVETVVAAADEALDASHAEVIALQEEAAALEVVVDAHVEKEAALANEQELLKARVADLEKENARLESRLYWTHVAIGVAAVVAAAGGIYALGVF